MKFIQNYVMEEKQFKFECMGVKDGFKFFKLSDTNKHKLHETHYKNFPSLKILKRECLFIFKQWPGCALYELLPNINLIFNKEHELFQEFTDHERLCFRIYTDFTNLYMKDKYIYSKYKEEYVIVKESSLGRNELVVYKLSLNPKLINQVMDTINFSNVNKKLSMASYLDCYEIYTFDAKRIEV